MKIAITAAAALVALSFTPALAQNPHAQASASDAKPTHEMCKAVMGSKMDPKQVHDHGRDKTGAATWPNGKPLSKAEMDKMHQTCAEMMKQAPAGAHAGH